MLRNYLLTAYKVFMRRKLFTAINLGCIVLTLVVLMVITALLDTAFWPSGVEGKSERLLQVYGIRNTDTGRHHTQTTLMGYKTVDKYLKPLVLLADEPTGNLDSKMGAEVMDILLKLNTEGTTVVMVTHDEQEARRVGRIVRVFDGQLVTAEHAHAA